MASFALLIVSLIGFSIVARELGRTILSKRHLLPYRTEFSYSALILERGYKITAYSVMAVLLFAALVKNFIDVLSGQPF